MQMTKKSALFAGIGKARRTTSMSDAGYDRLTNSDRFGVKKDLSQRSNENFLTRVGKVLPGGDFPNPSLGETSLETT
jgi:hypothetical protein